MSAAARIVISRTDEVIKVPLEAVFEKEGRTVVYLHNKKEVEVQVGRRNDMEIEIVEGLTGDESICLIDPTLDEPGQPGERATEPELNKGRPQPPAGQGQRPRGSGRRGR